MSNLNIVDQIGILKAAIAPLEKKLKALQDELKGQGPGRYEGEQYDATVSTYSVDRLDLAAVRAKLSPQFIRAHTIESEIVKLSVTAKKLPVAA